METAHDPVTKKEPTSRNVTVHEGCAGSTLLSSSPLTAISAAEPAGGVNLSNGTDRAAEPTDPHRSRIGISESLKSDFDSDESNDETVAAAVRPIQSSSAVVAIERPATPPSAVAAAERPVTSS